MAAANVIKYYSSETSKDFIFSLVNKILKLINKKTYNNSEIKPLSHKNVQFLTCRFCGSRDGSNT